MQLHQLFRTRAAVKITDYSEQPTFSAQHLIPPQIVQRLLSREESPSNNQDQSSMSHDLILGQVPLKIMCVTWNHAREHQNLDCDVMFPDYKRYNIIAFGGQECGGEKEEEVNLVQDFLGKDYIRIEFVGKGEIFLVVFVKEYDCRFMRDPSKNLIMKDLIGYGWKGGVMV